MKDVGLRRGRDDAHKILHERPVFVGPGEDGNILHFVSICIDIFRTEHQLELKKFGSPLVM